MSNHVVVECFRDEIEDRLDHWDDQDYDLLTCSLIEPKVLTIGETTHIRHDARYLLIFKSRSPVPSRR